MYVFGRGAKRFVPLIYLMIPLLLYVIFAFGPSIMTVIFSFTDVTGLPNQDIKFVGLENYRKIFFSSNSPERIASLGRSIIFAVSVTLIQNAVGLIMAMILNQKLKGSVLYRAIIFLPVVLGITAVGLIWKLILNPMFGPAQALLALFNTSSNFFGSFDSAFSWVIFVQIWMYMGFSMIVFLAGLQAIPKDLYEAGNIDGVSSIQSFKYITFPMIAPSLTVNILLSLIGALQTFDIIFVLTKGQFFTSTLAVDLFNIAFKNETLDQGLASSIGVIQFLFVFIVVIFAQFYLRKREVEV